MNYKKIAKKLKQDGVLFQDINHVYIDSEVQIEKGTVIEANVQIRGKTKVGRNNYIGMGSVIVNSTIGNNNDIRNSVIEESTLIDQNQVGPFSRIRGNSKIGSRNVIGNFVELKNVSIEEDSFVKHLSYLGDTDVKKDVNVGAGTITANFDTRTKEYHSSIIHDKVSIGANVTIISPVNINENSLIGAGTVLTKDVPENTLAIGRVHQENKEHYFEGDKHD